MTPNSISTLVAMLVAVEVAVSGGCRAAGTVTPTACNAASAIDCMVTTVVSAGRLASVTDTPSACSARAAIAGGVTTVASGGRIAAATGTPRPCSARSAMDVTLTTVASTGREATGTISTPSRRKHPFTQHRRCRHATVTALEGGAVVEPCALVAVTVQVAVCPTSADTTGSIGPSPGMSVSSSFHW